MISNGLIKKVISKSIIEVDGEQGLCAKQLNSKEGILVLSTVKHIEVEDEEKRSSCFTTKPSCLNT
jgi:hypothetical protein